MTTPAETIRKKKVDETIAITRGAPETLVWDHIEAALLCGACVMYCLLKDGAR